MISTKSALIIGRAFGFETKIDISEYSSFQGSYRWIIQNIIMLNKLLRKAKEGYQTFQ
jgi:hypothetical protein